jgi:hypothetical protein
MVGKLDRQNNPYFWTTLKLPASVDLSNCVIMVHTKEGPKGDLTAELVFMLHQETKQDKMDVVDSCSFEEEDSKVRY